jgi:hypothetical protein
MADQSNIKSKLRNKEIKQQSLAILPSVFLSQFFSHFAEKIMLFKHVNLCRALLK